MIKVYGSPLCPDCMACKASLDAYSIPYEFTDITGSMKNLKEFLALRDTKEEYKEARQDHFVGIPTIIREDGSFTFDWEGFIRECGHEPLAKAAGQACRLDGTGC